MAVYMMSLQRLASLRTPPRTATVRSPTGATGVPGVSGTEAVRATTESAGRRAGIVVPVACAQGSDEHPGPSASVERLLDMPTPQLMAEISECGQPGSKMLLALMYRLAAMETQLADRGSQEQGKGTEYTTPASTVNPRGLKPAAQAVASKSGLLVQVFLKNQSLRVTDGNNG